jgi:hypothetical protein
VKGERRRALVGGDHVGAGVEGEADMAERRLAARGVQHRGLHHHDAAVGAGILQRRQRVGEKSLAVPRAGAGPSPPVVKRRQHRLMVEAGGIEQPAA